MASLLLMALNLQAGDLRLNTVVIDPGHGGKDAGCISKDQKTYEKNLTLDISKKFAKYIKDSYPDVKVVMTRSTDEFIELRQRAAIANNASANLFISIHINAATTTSANGYSVHILGQSSDKNRDLFAYNMDVVKRENAVILLEDNYETKYKDFNQSDSEDFIFMHLMQNSYLEQSMLFASIVSEKLKGGPIKADRGIWQNPFYVLWKTAMPAVLVELGFISNGTDLAALRDESNRERLAGRLFAAFKDYKDLYDSSVSVKQDKAKDQASKTTNPAPAPKIETSENVSVGQTLYGTQIIASSRDIDPSDSMFMGYHPTVVNIGSLNKYIIGVSDDESIARSLNEKIKAKYPTSFMVKISDEGISRFK